MDFLSKTKSYKMKQEEPKIHNFFSYIKKLVSAP